MRTAPLQSESDRTNCDTKLVGPAVRKRMVEAVQMTCCGAGARLGACQRILSGKRVSSCTGWDSSPPRRSRGRAATPSQPRRPTWTRGSAPWVNELIVIEDPERRPLRALVNNAGISVNAHVEVLPLAEWRRLFDVNLFGHIAMLGGRPPDGITVPDWPVLNSGSKGDRPDERYHGRPGCRQERVPGIRGGCRQQGRAAQATEPGSNDRVLREAAADGNRHRGVRLVASLGPDVDRDGPHGAAGPGRLRPPLCQTQQDRRARCRSDLRGDAAAGHAVRADQDRRATGRSRHRDRTRHAGAAAHAIDEPPARLAG